MNITNALEFTSFSNSGGTRTRSVYVALLPYRLSADEQMIDTNPTQHLFYRGSDDGWAGDGNLFHARSRVSSPMEISDDDIVETLRAIYSKASSVPLREIHLLIGGSTSWIPVYSEKHAYVFYTGGVCHLRYYSNRLQVVWIEDLILHHRSGNNWMDRYEYVTYDNPSYWDNDPMVTFTRVWPTHAGIRAYGGVWTNPLFTSDWQPWKPLSLDNLDWCSSLSDLFESSTQLGFIEDHNLARAAATAYQAAVQQLPQIGANTIQSILECVQFLTAPLDSIPRNVSDAWLAYRYAFSTSKLDLKEYASYACRLDTLLASCTSLISCHGAYRYREYDIKCCCQFRLSDILPSDFSGWLRSIGVQINLYNVWDMIPYSFIVDWFLHIGDILETFESYGRSLSLTPTGVWYSFQTSRNQHGSYQDVYIRVKGSGKNHTMPFYSYHEASGRTLLMRVTDSYSLLLG